MKYALLGLLVLALTASGCTNKQKRKSAEKKYVAELFDGCAAVDGRSCYSLAKAAETVRQGAYVYKTQPSFNVGEVYQTAIVLLDSECAASNATSCGLAGEFYQTLGHKRETWEEDYYPSHAHRINPLTGKHQTARWPLSKGYVKDREMAVEYFTKSCQLSDARSCRDLGDALSGPPVENLAASQEAYDKAVGFYLSECEAGAKRLFSCDKATHILVYKMKTPQSIQRGLDLHKKGCDEGFAKDCSYVGAIHTNDRFGREDKSVARAYFQRACDLDKENYCRAIQKLGASTQ